MHKKLLNFSLLIVSRVLQESSPSVLLFISLRSVKKKRDANFKHSLKLRTCISFIYVFKTKQRMNTRHGDNKREIIWDIPKATSMAIVPVVVERYAQHSYSSSLFFSLPRFSRELKL